MAYPLFVKPRAGSVSSNAFKLHNEKERQPSRYRSCPDDNRSTCSHIDGEHVKQGLVIWGASGHALVVAEIIRLMNTYQIIGMIDDMKPERAGSEFAGYEVLGGRESLDSLWERQVRTMIVGFGNCHGRLQVARFLRERGFLLATAVHPRATVAADVSIGDGSVIVAGSVINPAAAIGENVIINTGSSVDHECVIGDGGYIAPGCIWRRVSPSSEVRGSVSVRW